MWQSLFHATTWLKRGQPYTVSSNILVFEITNTLYKKNNRRKDRLDCTIGQKYLVELQNEGDYWLDLWETANVTIYSFEQSIEKKRETLLHNDGFFSFLRITNQINSMITPLLNPKMKKILMSKMPYQSKITSTFFFQIYCVSRSLLIVSCLLHFLTYPFDQCTGAQCIFTFIMRSWRVKENLDTLSK